MSQNQLTSDAETARGLGLPPVPPELIRYYRGIRSFQDIYNDPGWPSALENILERVCPSETNDQPSRAREFIELWCKCRSVCRTWRAVIENPNFGITNPQKENLAVVTFKNRTFATATTSAVTHCAMATKWVQKKINYEVNAQGLSHPDPNRRFGLRCFTEFRLTFRNSTALQMYASVPVVKDVRIRSFIRQFEVDQRKTFLYAKGFNIPGASIIREWDGWSMNAPGGIQVEMLVGFVALAVEIDVLMQNASVRPLQRTPRPGSMTVEFLHVDVQNVKVIWAVKFDIPRVAGQVQPAGNDLWANLMNVATGSGVSGAGNVGYGSGQGGSGG
ncbi:hypothetical protein TWF281_004775 [Arthrobotrys megalospora]